MENLTPEQIEQLNEIAKLPQNEQQYKLQEFLGSLSEEQVEYLKKQQEQNCPFCSIVIGNVLANKIYEDSNVVGVLDLNPANDGHFIVFPKEHVGNSFEMKQEGFTYLMSIVNLLSKKMQLLTKADGFNILIANGNAAGQRAEHFLVHAIPRFKEDGISLNWKGKHADENFNKKIIKEFTNTRIIDKKPEIKNQQYYHDEERIP